MPYERRQDETGTVVAAGLVKPNVGARVETPLPAGREWRSAVAVAVAVAVVGPSANPGLSPGGGSRAYVSSGCAYGGVGRHLLSLCCFPPLLSGVGGVDMWGGVR